MAIALSVPNPTEPELRPRITVVGVGGAGGNAVSNMIRSNLEGVDFVVTNTDAQALAQNLAERRIQLGTSITRGLGAGSRPEVGRAAAEEVIEEILSQLQGSNMVFITAGMGGGTGTGAAPVIARAAREHGILTVGVITKPFQFEGAHRMRIAEAGIQDLQQYVDTLIVIPNQNLFRVANERTTFADAFKMADDVLASGVRGVTDLMVMPGLINLDFADIRAVMGEMGKAMMGTGEAAGDRRALDAAEAAISNPLLEDTSMKGARGMLINITGGLDMTLFEVDEAANRIRDEVDPDANIIFGSTFDATMEGRMRVSVVATGIESEVGVGIEPKRPAISLVAERGRPAFAPTAPGRAEAVAAPTMAPAMAPTMTTAAPTVGAPHATVAPMQQGAYAVTPAVAQAAPAAPRYDTAPTAQPRYETHGAAAVATEVQNAAQTMARPALKPEAPTRPMPAPPVAAADGPFIAPRPVDPGLPPASSLAAAQVTRADVFAEAAYANAGGRAPAAPEPAPVAPAAPRAAAPSAPEAPAETVAQKPAEKPLERPAEKPRAPSLFERVTGAARGRSKPATEPTLRAAPAAVPSQPNPQASLGAVDPGERSVPSQATDDLLDIPAFLRRQAN
ncbi:MAG TPA: cell division protein FtsZ [Candidatus Sulfotelmatobacter sp.]|nr:cell division protein FtsZ [Candidatus Sulfotelmatobacter sp.]